MADGGLSQVGIVPDAGNWRAFRDALGHFATGVTVVTIAGPSGPMGFTANSFASLSLDPPLVLWSLARTSQRFTAFATARHYAIHVLAEDQRDFATRFSRGGAAGPDPYWEWTHEGVPALPGVLARFDCAQHATHDGGDHLIIVGQVLRLTLEEGRPLVFAQGRFGGFAG
jgi:flavin reductase (DIM6/NTAB) family NADH-FMN oxidoreductase RutF